MKNLINNFASFVGNTINKVFMKNHLDNIHALVGSNFENFDDYETESYDEAMYDEHYDMVENYKVRGASQIQATQRANDKIMAKYGNKGVSFVNTLKKQPSKIALATNTSGKMGLASFDLIVTRVTSKLAYDLPICLFAPIYESSGYYTFINEYLPVGIFCTVLPAVQGGVIFQFTDGTNTDQVFVVCNQTPYIAMLEAIAGGDKLNIGKTRYRISNTAYLQQYDKTNLIVSKSILGTKSSADLTVNSFIEPTQFQAGIVDIKVQIPFDRERGWLQLVAPSATSVTTSESYQLTMFVKSYISNNVNSYAN
jgi:hypothetical protein